MIYSALKWYALTLGAWKRYKWWKALTRWERLDYIIKKMYRVPVMLELQKKPMIFGEGNQFTVPIRTGPKFADREPTEEEWRNMQGKVEAGSMRS